MARRLRDLQFTESLVDNNYDWRHYYNRLFELGTTMFEWKGLPDTIDERFMEITLFNQGHIVFFEDKVLGKLCLPSALGGKFNVYRIPLKRNIIANNGYHKMCTNKDSIIVWNNYLHSNSRLDIQVFAKKLYNLDRAIDVNVNAQKTPILIQCDENERLSLKNAYKEYDGNAYVIWGDKRLNPNCITVLKTDAPYVSDKLYVLKTQIWNEALTYLGINNVNITKKERLLNDEVNRNQGGTIASRYSRLIMRQKACEEINRMFGTNISVDYREDLKILDEAKEDDVGETEKKEGENNE